MKVKKKKLLNILQTLAEKEDRISAIKDEILEIDELFPFMESIYYYTYAMQYFLFLKMYVEKSKEEDISLNELFKRCGKEIKNIAEYFSIDKDSTEYWTEIGDKIEYSLSKNYLNSNEIKKLNLQELEETTNEYLIRDFLIEFSKRFQKEIKEAIN